jgi:hypothetical protein
MHKLQGLFSVLTRNTHTCTFSADKVNGFITFFEMRDPYTSVFEKELDRNLCYIAVKIANERIF